MHLKIKTSNEATFGFDVEEGTLVRDLKQMISDHYKGETSVADQRLIFAGKVLKDEETLGFYKLSDGNTVHLVRGGVKKAAPPSSAATPQPAATQSTAAATAPNPITENPLANMFGTASGLPPLGSFTGGPGIAGMGGMQGMGGMPGMQGMMNDPMFAAMMSQMMSNPQMLDMVISSNPQLAQMITPEMRQQMQSPEFQALVSNPQMMQQMLQMQQLMGGVPGMGGMGAGMNPLANMYGQPVPPSQAPAGLGAANPFLQAMMNANRGASPAVTGAANPAAPAAPTQPPEELYATQLQQLRDMGFYSPAENIRALQITGGNVEMAVEWLFSRPPGSM